jgi:hypothetical protein
VRCNKLTNAAVEKAVEVGKNHEDGTGFGGGSRWTEGSGLVPDREWTQTRRDDGGAEHRESQEAGRHDIFGCREAFQPEMSAREARSRSRRWRLLELRLCAGARNREDHEGPGRQRSKARVEWEGQPTHTGA